MPISKPSDAQSYASGERVESGVNTDKVVKAENAVNAASVGVDVNVESVGSIVTNVSTEKAENYEFGASDRIG